MICQVFVKNEPWSKINPLEITFKMKSVNIIILAINYNISGVSDEFISKSLYVLIINIMIELYITRSMKYW